MDAPFAEQFSQLIYSIDKLASRRRRRRRRRRPLYERISINTSQTESIEWNKYPGFSCVIHSLELQQYALLRFSARIRMQHKLQPATGPRGPSAKTARFVECI